MSDPNGDWEPDRDKDSKYRINDDEFKKAKAEGKLKYQDAEYHGKAKQGSKSPAPRNPEKSLQRSIRIKAISYNRIFVDIENGKDIEYDVLELVLLQIRD